jgi:hypothetical protein
MLVTGLWCTAACGDAEDAATATSAGGTTDASTTDTSTTDASTTDTSTTDASTTAPGTTAAMTDGGTTDASTTDATTGGDPERLDCPGLANPCGAVDLTASAAWDGSDYSSGARCLLEAARDAGNGLGDPLQLDTGYGLSSDSPTRERLVLVPDGSALVTTALRQTTRSPNGGETTREPTVTCVVGSDALAACVTTPALDCLDLATWLECGATVAPSCPEG